MFPVFIKKHLSDIRSYVIFSIVFFLISVAVGYIFAEKNPAETVKIIESFRKMIEEAGDPGSIKLAEYLFLRNAFASLLAMALGVILGLFPLLGLLTNGIILGIFAFLFSSKASSLLIFLAGILPHGIFELPAFFFAAATGLWLGAAAFRWLAYDGDWIKNKFTQGIKFFFFAIVPLLMLAAFVESFITPKILELLIGE